LKELHKRSEQEAYIRRRIRRNPYDIWAGHELGFLILSRVDLVSGDQRAAMLEEMDGVLKRMQTIASDHPVSHALMGDTLSSRKDFERAVDHYLKAIDDDPAYTYCYSRIWEVSQPFAESRQIKLLETLEHHMFRVVGFLHGARSLTFNIAERFGAEKAKACVERWSVRKPDDPELIEARVDLLLNYGKGRSDAATAVEILESALARFPNHLGLWESLAQAYHTLLMPDKEEEVLREILRRYPLIADCRNRLARIINENGDADTAIALLREGLDFDPLSVSGWHPWPICCVTRTDTTRLLASLMPD
jgi:tetratricopeptide (TPR) repeat protein